MNASFLVPFFLANSPLGVTAEDRLSLFHSCLGESTMSSILHRISAEIADDPEGVNATTNRFPTAIPLNYLATSPHYTF